MKAQISYDDFAKLDLRVGTITSVQKLENADKLYKLTVDLGKEIGAREIVSGIAQEYAEGDLQGKQIIVLVNLAPKKVRGEVSNGMLLAAVTEDGGAVLLNVDKKVEEGTGVC